MDKLIYGKSGLERVVGAEWKNSVLTIFIEHEADIETIEIDHEPYTLFDGPVFKECRELEGKLPLRYYKKYENENDQKWDAIKARRQGYEIWRAFDTIEGALISKGITFYRGMDPTDVSILSLDIETTGVNPKDSIILSISTTFRKGKTLEKRLFAYDDYANEKLMVQDFADYVRKMDPSILTGYNILGFDIPFILERHPNVLLGRNRSKVFVSEETKEKRKDASQSYSFRPCHVYGRQIVDAFHLTIDYDLSSGRKLPSYKLKEVMAFLELEKEGRAHYDASKIRHNYMIPEEWEKIKAYNIDDADDVITLLDHLWEPFFYFSQHIPMTFERQTQTATGTKINNMMLRAYIQDRHSVPIGDEKKPYEGGLVIGNFGLFEHCNKVDVKSMHPSIMVLKNICVDHKDPLKYFPKLVTHFRKARIDDKDLYEKTKIKKYKSQSEAKKIFINSLYGFLGARRLNFNSMAAASEITAESRDILRKGISWSDKKNYTIVNADTDSFMYSSGKRIPAEAFAKEIIDLNSIFPSQIEWEHDGQYEKVLVLKSKNYVLVEYGGKTITKGNSIKATMKEPALRKFISDVISHLLDKRTEFEIARLYVSCVFKILQIGKTTPIDEWCSKITVTKAILEKSKTRQARIRESLAGSNYKEADKAFIFFETKEKVCLLENFNGVFYEDAMFKKLFSTAEIFDNVFNTDILINFAHKRSKSLLQSLKSESDIDAVAKALCEGKKK